MKQVDVFRGRDLRFRKGDPIERIVDGPRDGTTMFPAILPPTAGLPITRGLTAGHVRVTREEGRKRGQIEHALATRNTK